MINEINLKDTIRDLIEDVIKEEMTQGAIAGALAESAKEKEAVCQEETDTCDDGFVEDLTAISMEEQFYVPNPYDREGYMKMKQTTTGRLGIWRAGPRPVSKSYLRFWADHAAAQNAVWTDVDSALIEKLDLIALNSIAEDKAEYLKNPGTGKKLTEESVEIVKKNTVKDAQVQIVFADGLSSKAVEKNAEDVLPALEQGLKSVGLSYAKPFFVSNGRVAVSDEIGEITGADVVVMLVGERPGLNSTSSLGAYMCYKPIVGMEESRRTVISNIHMRGTVPVEAGAQIAEICKSMIEHKMSGVDLKIVGE
jgi:ethanolamine ammonia-lyase small subunit